MLRRRSSGVAEKSQHILGKAMDYYIPDVKLSKLREIGIKFQVGGVGFYPKSGSPFVHMDVGGVRAWPRMPRRELARLFPDGRTIHRPAEGGTMPGYAAAMADYRKRVGAKSIEVAGGGSKDSDNVGRSRGKNLLAALFSGGDEDEGDDSVVTTQVAKAEPRKPKQQQTILAAATENKTIDAPIPGVRPAGQTSLTALFSQKKNPAEEAMQAALTPQPEEKAPEEVKDEFVNLAKLNVPVPELLGTRRRPGDVEDAILTASAEPMDAASALQAGMIPTPDLRPSTEIAAADPVDNAADLDGDISADELAALAKETNFAAVNDNRTDEEEAVDLNDKASLTEMASLELPKATATRSFILSPEAVAEGFADTIKKGGRPSAKVTGETADKAKLTRNAIAKWALANGRVEELTKPVKAPRFVANGLTEKPATVSNVSFSTKIDPARFGPASFKAPESN